MQTDEPRIKLGTASPPLQPLGPDSGPPSIPWGTVQEPKPAENNTPAPPTNSTSEQKESGFSTEKIRQRAAVLRHEQAKAKEPMVRPWILVAVFGAIFVLLVLLLLGPHRSGALGFNDPTILRQYDEYRGRKHNTRLPSKETVGDLLNRIAMLENSGQKERAKHSWQQLVVETQTDKENPLYQLAVNRLQSAH